MNATTFARLVTLLAGVELILLAGCNTNLGIPDAQLVTSYLPQSWDLKSSPDQVYAAVVAEVTSDSKNHVAVQNVQERVTSWSVPVAQWEDLYIDSVQPVNTDVGGSGVPAKYVGAATAFTTVWVESLPQGQGCRLHVKHGFLTEQALSNIGPSRGDFEHDFVGSVCRRLGENQAVAFATKGD